MLGNFEGKAVGRMVGFTDGVIVGRTLGEMLGSGVGGTVGLSLGGAVGVGVGALVGTRVGASCEPNSTYAVPVSATNALSANGAPIIKSWIPSPLKSAPKAIALPALSSPVAVNIWNPLAW